MKRLVMFLGTVAACLSFAGMVSAQGGGSSTVTGTSNSFNPAITHFRQRCVRTFLIKRHLVISASACVHAFSGITDILDQNLFNIHMYIFR